MTNFADNAKTESTFSVYALWSVKAKRIYIGHTTDISRRLQEHARPQYGKTGYTHKNGPWELIHQENGFKTRKEAMKREKYLKGSRGRIWVKQFIPQDKTVEQVRPAQKNK